MNDKVSQDSRFEELYVSYAKAQLIADRLIDSGLIEIKHTKLEYHTLRTGLTINLSEVLRGGAGGEVDPDLIARSYFRDLDLRGQEWAFADLGDRFEPLLQNDD